MSFHDPVARPNERPKMTVTISAFGDTCVLTEKTCSTSVDFPLPISKAGLIALLRTVLADATCDAAQDGVVRVDRMRDGPRVSHGSSMFAIRYTDACPLVLEG